MTAGAEAQGQAPLAGDALVRLLGLQAIDAEAVEEAVRAAAEVLPEAARQALAESGLRGLGEAVLLEGQFGSGHFTLSGPRRVYYRIRPLMPAAALPLLRRGVVSREGSNGPLRWPVEDRFVTFAEQVRGALGVSVPAQAPNVAPAKAPDTAPETAPTKAPGEESDMAPEEAQAPSPDRPFPWWPDGHSCAVVLTHDVEGPFGLSHLLDVLAEEGARGFRSSVSFVGDTYKVPDSLLREMREEGFEVALHGWRHDGRLFESRARFERQLPRMNARLRQWESVGFRSPMTHREPGWMQGLEVQWDSSFFDTDPFEPMPGGVMTIWPYVLGRFAELPYTLPQDHTLIETLGETSPRMWLEKLDFLAAHQGMALVNTHPDYLCRGRMALYEEFLDELARRPGAWRALPRDVAAWTRARWDGVPAAG